MVLTKALGFYGWKITNKKKEILPGIQEHNYAVDGKVHFLCTTVWFTILHETLIT